MKLKWRFFFIIFLLSAQLKAGVFEKSGEFNKHFLDLLNYMDIQNDGSLESIMKATQTKWFQPSQNMFKIDAEFESKRDSLVEYFQKMGILSPMRLADQNGKLLTNQSFDYGFVAGGFVFETAQRIELLVKIAKDQKIHFKNIVLMGSQRPLNRIYETPMAYEKMRHVYDWLKLPEPAILKEEVATLKTEHDNNLFLIKYANFPSGFFHGKPEFINSPMKRAPDGTLERASTADTIWVALDLIPPHSHVQVVLSTTQPVGEYMDIVAQKIFNQGGDLKKVRLITVADLHSHWSLFPMSIALNYLARTVYAKYVPAAAL